MNWFKIIQFLYIAAIPFVAIYGLHRYFIIYLYYRHRREKLKPKDSFKELPTITIQLPIYKERYVVERLIDSICALEYPQERLQIQVLDDSKDETHEIIQRKVDRADVHVDLSPMCVVGGFMCNSQCRVEPLQPFSIPAERHRGQTEVRTH